MRRTVSYTHLERYELLEKLIGCEETYTNIATEIKKAKDQATDEIGRAHV